MTEKRAVAWRECGIEPMIYPEMVWSDETAASVVRLSEVFPAMAEDLSVKDGASLSVTNHGTGGNGGRDAGRPGTAWGAGLGALSGADVSDGVSCASASEDTDVAASGEIPAHAKLLAEAEQRGWARGWNEGIQEGRKDAHEQARANYEQMGRDDRERLQSTVVELTEGFAVERERYFHAVEQESVRLALAIAARILRREAQMDPLLLSGAVRVALGQVSESTSVRLLVPEPDAELWRESLRLTPGLRARPEVVGVSGMKLGECRIETEFGNVDMGLLGQLQEIERGFFDRVGSPARTAAEERRSRSGAWKQPGEFHAEAAGEDGVPVCAATVAVGETER